MIDYLKTIKDIESIYLNDNRPWIIGLSGGKDSTCVTQLVYYMLKGLPQNKRKKDVHILSADTLVESPVIETRIKKISKKIEKQVLSDKLPIKVKILQPELNDTFWVNLIGRGYPSPNRWFRWCTERLKINPMTRYIQEKVKENGEIIILLGARKSESGTRAQTMGKYEIKDFKFEITGTGAVEEGIITSGGVSVDEIDPKTMESKIVPGLYFAGEVIDVDALTGGFNLQIAWSTGYAAGEN